MEEQAQIKTVQFNPSNVTFKNKMEPVHIDHDNYHPKTDNETLEIKEEEKMKLKTLSSRKKQKKLRRSTSVPYFFDHYDVNNCEHCHGMEGIYRNDKSRLSSFIEKNSSFLKLFGNPRYNDSSPHLFVEDHKSKIDNKRIGLLPIPSKPKLILKTKEEKNKLYELQRKIVMMRRYQYGNSVYSKDIIWNNNRDGGDFFENINIIQKWWKQIYKIIQIQKIFKGYRIRKRVVFIFNFIDIINHWENILYKIKARRYFRLLANSNIKQASNNNKEYSQQIPKKDNNVEKEPSQEEQKISYEKKNYDNKINPINGQNEEEEEEDKNNPRLKVINPVESITKEYYNKFYIIEQINKIGDSFRKYYKNKKDLMQNPKNLKKIGKGYYIEKINKILKPPKKEEKSSNGNIETNQSDRDKYINEVINTNEFIYKNKNSYIAKSRKAKKYEPKRNKEEIKERNDSNNNIEKNLTEIQKRFKPDDFTISKENKFSYSHSTKNINLTLIPPIKKLLHRNNNCFISKETKKSKIEDNVNHLRPNLSIENESQFNYIKIKTENTKDTLGEKKNLSIDTKERFTYKSTHPKINATTESNIDINYKNELVAQNNELEIGYINEINIIGENQIEKEELLEFQKSPSYLSFKIETNPKIEYKGRDNNYNLQIEKDKGFQILKYIDKKVETNNDSPNNIQNTSSEKKITNFINQKIYDIQYSKESQDIQDKDKPITQTEKDNSISKTTSLNNEIDLNNKLYIEYIGKKEAALPKDDSKYKIEPIPQFKIDKLVPQTNFSMNLGERVNKNIELIVANNFNVSYEGLKPSDIDNIITKEEKTKSNDEKNDKNKNLMVQSILKLDCIANNSNDDEKKEMNENIKLKDKNNLNESNDKNKTKVNPNENLKPQMNIIVNYLPESKEDNFTIESIEKIKYDGDYVMGKIPENSKKICYITKIYTEIPNKKTYKIPLFNEFEGPNNIIEYKEIPKEDEKINEEQNIIIEKDNNEGDKITNINEQKDVKKDKEPKDIKSQNKTNLIEEKTPDTEKSDIYIIKSNHVLKVVKFEKGKSKIIKTVQGGRVLVKEPGLSKSQIIHSKYIDNKNSPKEENLILEDEDNNIEDPLLKNKYLKINKHNLVNYFYATKIRKGEIEDSPITKIQENFRNFEEKKKIKENLPNFENFKKKPFKDGKSSIITKVRKNKSPPLLFLQELPNKNNNSFITKERKKIISNCLILPEKKNHFISKKRIINNMNQIKTIQKTFRSQKSKKGTEQVVLCPKGNNTNNNKDNNIQSNSNYDNKGYISKVNKIITYRLSPKKDNCFITKEKLEMQISKEKKNISFVSLLEFFVKKNIQEYIYYKLIDNDELTKKNRNVNNDFNYDTNNNIIIDKKEDENFTYPKYYKTLKRIYSFYKTKKRGNSPSSQKIYDKLLPGIENTKSLNELIIQLNDLSSKNKDNNSINNLDIDNNDDKINPNDYINEIGEFVKYDKNLSNSAFIKNKLKDNKNLNQEDNLFIIINSIDDEYNNLINGKYCCKCGNEILKCKCDDINYLFKESEQEEEINEEDEDLDFDAEDNLNKNKKVNYFEYDSNKTKGLLISKKPQLNEYMVEQPIKKVIFYNQNQIQEINRSIQEKSKFNINKSIKLNHLNHSSNNSFGNDRYDNIINNSLKQSKNSNV